MGLAKGGALIWSMSPFRDGKDFVKIEYCQLCPDIFGEMREAVACHQDRENPESWFGLCEFHGAQRRMLEVTWD